MKKRKKVEFKDSLAVRSQRYNQLGEEYKKEGDKAFNSNNGNMKKAMAVLLDKEKKYADEEKRTGKKKKLTESDERFLLFWVYKIENNADRIHYMQRLQKLTGLSHLSILQRANVLEREEEDKRRKKGENPFEADRTLKKGGQYGQKKI